MKSAQTTLPLTVLLADTPEDDNSGQIATQGFGYQEWYAVLRVTELLEKSDDFAVGLEVKEDVSVIDSATAPSKVEFCQVKTNEQAAAWVFAELHRKGRKLKDGTYPPSILGKLFKRRHQFAGHKTTLRFVSNSSFKVPSGADTINTHDYHLDNLTDESKKVLRQALSEQLSVALTDIELTESHLHRSNLPLGEQYVFISGKLSKLASTGALPFKVPQPDVAATMLASEIRAKASNTSFAATFDDLKSKRFFTRKDAITTLLRLSTPPRTLDVIFDEGIARLNAEGYDYSLVEDIKRERVPLFLAAADRTNTLFRNQVAAVSRAHSHIKSHASHAMKQLGSLIEAVAAQAKKESPDEFIMVQEPFLYALTFVVIHNGIDINVFTATPSPQPEVTK